MDKKAIKELYRPVLDLIEEGPPNPLIPKQTRKAEAENKITHQVEAFGLRLIKGYHILLKEIDLMRFEDPDFISDSSWERLNDIILEDEISFEEFHDKPLLEIFKLQEEDLLKLYSAADRIFAFERFQEASDALFFLSHMQPTNSVFWLALGISEYFQDRWNEAAQAFMLGMASSDTPDLKNVVYLAHCYKNMGDKIRAREIIDSLLSYFNKEDLEDLGDLNSFRMEL